MKLLVRRRPNPDARASSWARIPNEGGGCTWHLYRKDHRRATHMIRLSYPARICRTAVARDLRAAYRELRNRVDEIDLTLMEAA